MDNKIEPDTPETIAAEKAAVESLLAAAREAQAAEPAPPTPEPEPAEQQDDLPGLFARQQMLSAQLASSRKRVTELQADLEAERDNQTEITRQYADIRRRVLEVFGIEAQAESQPTPAAAPTVAPTTPRPARKLDNSVVVDVSVPLTTATSGSAPVEVEAARKIPSLQF